MTGSTWPSQVNWAVKPQNKKSYVQSIFISLYITTNYQSWDIHQKHQQKSFLQNGKKKQLLEEMTGKSEVNLLPFLTFCEAFWYKKKRKHISSYINSTKLDLNQIASKCCKWNTSNNLHKTICISRKRTKFLAVEFTFSLLHAYLPWSKAPPNIKTSWRVWDRPHSG